jgi:putative intracellular protease/amidase
MRHIAYVLVVDGFADWEPGLALFAIKYKTKYEVVSVGLSKATVTTFGGLKVIPDIALSDVKVEDACIFIIPGAKMWKDAKSPEGLDELLMKLNANGVPIAAICAATFVLGRLGMFKGTRHTSTSKESLEKSLPDYQDGDFYVDEMAASDKGIITASGAGSVEFSLEIAKVLKIYNDAELKVWYDLLKHGILPPEGMI